MRAEFIKMHGLGNDFVVLDARAQALPEMTPAMASALADRHTGIGCDQLIVLGAADNADIAMRIFNHDGGEVEACGNATRAVGLLLGKPATIRTAGGLLHVAPADAGIEVDMGQPRFDWQDIPLADPMDTLDMPVGWEALERPVAVNVGNPHAVFLVPDCDAVELERLGPVIENDPLFPQRVNVNVASIETRSRIRLRVWERGAGLTRACGTGACATAVAAMRRKLVDRAVTVGLPGGDLHIAWPSDDASITMTGPAIESYRGSFEWDDYA
ncbi:diaminopimelate epimerase [Paraurantiacibacter namhicola]|uniref:Diaminopimelate epimerase n=1 Tax=Paraurantiacibacter namhicola TaxID=645517 RepID=A0A1C7D9V6_9SPHN|nr:diaminopimelate epimerase [Paraurantiacibacter namhicola]ANU08244.1 Diaminopimelate epimerase [Paraurantiacibacter namhicola]